MADGKETKPRTIRIEEETMDKFRSIAASIGGNQDQTLKKLIEIFEMQSEKSRLADRRTEIEKFESYTSMLTQMFLLSLEDCKNATDTAKSEFDASLKSKDETIRDLQEKLSDAKREKGEADERAKAAAKENSQLEGELNHLKILLEDKEKLNKALTDSCDDLKKKIVDIEKAAEQNSELREQLKEMKANFDDMTKERNDLSGQLKKVTEEHRKEIELLKKNDELEKEKAILITQKEFQDKLDQIRKEKQEEIQKYQERYLQVLERISGDGQKYL